MATLVKGGKTVRYYDPTTGRQREKTFGTRPEARHFKAQVELAVAEGSFVDPKLGSRKLADAAQSWLARHPGTDKSKDIYERALRLHVLPIFGNRSLSAVANDREGVERWVRETLPAEGLGSSSIRTCYMVLNSIVNDALRAGKLTQSRLAGIRMPAQSVKADIPFATHEQITTMAEKMPGGYGATLYLMRGCGLRIGEALGMMRVRGGNLRLYEQLAPDGKRYMPLKHRGESDYRDIPIPEYVERQLPWAHEGNEWAVTPVSHRTYGDWFNRARDAVGLPRTFTPHTLRHTFASVALAGGVPITDVSKWLGHRSIQTTYGIYGHLVPASWDRARSVLDEEWTS